MPAVFVPFYEINLLRTTDNPSDIVFEVHPKTIIGLLNVWCSDNYTFDSGIMQIYIRIAPADSIWNLGIMFPFFVIVIYGPKRVGQSVSFVVFIN